MTPERWEQIDRVWHAVLDRPEHERPAALDQLCSGDDQLRRDLESLLAHRLNASAAGFGTQGAVSGAGRESFVGRHIGPYAVQGLLGVGGMGEVYEAHDATLGRDVAIKILPEPWMADNDRLARFDREARLLASLNHPNIAAIYGVHESEGVRALVLELVAGETLAARITRHAEASSGRRGLPLVDIVSIATQLIDALEAAHGRGVIHRDLKPANVKITPDGRVKVLDFGLARPLNLDDGSPSASAPEPSIDSSQAGALFGTAAYMSPEQARGQSVDRRTDIWAFGCVLYEMLTGAPAFAGDSLADVLARVIGQEPDWNVLPRETPEALRLCLRRTLHKDPRQRFHDIADVRLALEGAFDATATGTARNVPRPRVRSGWIGAAIVGAAAMLIAVPAWRARAPDAAETRLQLVTPLGSLFDFPLSPDGRMVVYPALVDNAFRLWIRPFDADDARPLPGTEGASNPFWSPDGRAVGFFADRALKRVDLASGRVRTIADAPDPRAGAWGADNTIVFGPGTGPLLRVNAEGGAVEEATALLPRQSNHRRPQFLPDGRRFLLLTLGAPDVRGIYLGSLDDTRIRRVLDVRSPFVFLPPDQVLLARDGGLWAQRLDATYTGPQGELAPVAPRVLVERDLTGMAALSASASGTIAYRPSFLRMQLVWLDRTGRETGVVGEPDDSQPGDMQLAPDGFTLAAVRGVGGNTDIWIYDARGTLRRLTSDPGVDGSPIFSPDGRRIAFVSDGRADVWEIYERAADGTGAARLLLESGENKFVLDWSPDGRYLLYGVQSSKTDFDLWALPLFGDRTPIAIANTQFAEGSGQFSPDGRWVVFDSNETGRSEIYIQPFPGPGPKSRISSDGGALPQWSKKGQEVFYLAPDSRLMAVPVTQRRSALTTGDPAALFVLPAPWAGVVPSHDGQRFLTFKMVDTAPPLTVLINWRPPGS